MAVDEAGVEAMQINTIFNEISLQNPRGDIFGGITAAVIALPMALITCSVFV